MSYESFSKDTRSQKIILAHLEAKERLKLFTLHTGAVYKRTVNHFVTSVKVNNVQLSSASSISLTSGSFYYSPTEGILYLRLADDSNPLQASVYVTYRFFYSNIPCNLPANITSGEVVPYDPRIKSIGALKLELDYENTGIALETNSSIALENTDGELDKIFDTLVWDNNRAKFWSWSRKLPASEARVIYRGLITDKAFTPVEVKFTLKDELSKLRQDLSWPVFSSDLDGNIDTSTEGTAKRLVFGRMDKLRTVGVDKVLEGYQLSGTVTGSANRNKLTGTVSALLGSNTINGVGTSFTTQLTVGAKIRVYNSLNEFTYTVDTLPSNTTLTISGTTSAAFSGYEARNMEIKNNIVTGGGSQFISELSPEDKFNVEVDGVTYEYEVESVDSDSQVTLADEVEVTFTSVQAFNKPNIPYRGVNRRWHIAGHKLRQYSVTVTSILDSTNIYVDNLRDIESGDTISHNEKLYKVVRVIGNKITFNQSLISPVAGDILIKVPVIAAYDMQGNTYVIGRDFSVQNTTDAVLQFMPEAEFNVTPSRNSPIQFNFTAGSRTVTITATDTSLKDILKPRDWIRARSINLPDWYEVLKVDELECTLRTPALVTYSGTIQFKSPDYLSDDSLITVDCLGLQTPAGDWIRYPAQAVKWLLESNGLTDINTASFTEASDDCQFTLALAYPETIGDDLPIIRDMITDINQSVFGSLYLNNSFQYSYSILNSDKPEELDILKDEDILSFSVATKSNIVNSVMLEYSPYVDMVSGEDVTRAITLESDFVNEAVEKVEQLKVKSFLYYEEDAQVIAERWLFFRSYTQTVVTIQTKLNLALKTLNDKVFLSLARLYKRYGGGSKSKIGIINSISKDGSNTTVQINDLGNIFNRVPAVAPDTAEDYVEGSLELAKYGYVLDNDTETPDATSELELGNNLIG